MAPLFHRLPAPLRAVVPMIVGVLTAGSARADEGMWPFDMVPVQRISQEHKVTLTPEWLDHVRLASVRFNSGGSGSFVSPRGLVLTNHHVASDCIAKLASVGHDTLETGYLAGKDGPEIACPDLELDQLQSIEDVTPRVLAARRAGMSDADANKAMKAQMASVEKECHDATHLRCDVVTLYAGAMYRLYRYQRFEDVRLVFAPEQSIAFFGGDPDNFNYPRFDLDMAVFRVYEGGQPVDSSRFFLRWSPQGPRDGDVVFVSGNPGKTDRDDTTTQLETLRDVVYARRLAYLRDVHDSVAAYAKRGREPNRQAKETIFGLENSIKAYFGFQAGLHDAALMKRKEGEESKLRAAVDASAELKARLGGTWDEIARVQKTYAYGYPRFEALDATVRGTLLGDARALVRLAGQRSLPNDQRLPEFRETHLDELRSHVLAPAAIYPGVEEAFVRAWLVRLQRALGDDPTVRSVLAGRSPERAAREMVAQSRLFDVYARRALWDGGQTAIGASTDPIVVAMRALEPSALAARKQQDDDVEAPMRGLGRKVAEAKFAALGTRVAPDATFTLRLSPGVVRGYEEHGQRVPWSTDFAGLARHATGKTSALTLPPRWVAALAQLGRATPFDFVSTNDIIGGNSGSPVVSASGELVGLIFDGNIESLPDRFIYQDSTARAVSVDTAAMLEALRVVYGAEAIAAELAPAP